jgi:hypothetical protein
MKKDYADFLRHWPWEWFATLTFKYPIGKETAINQLRLWTRYLCKLEGIQTAYIAVLNYTNPTPHVHALLLARCKDGVTLQDIPTDKWESIWAHPDEPGPRVNGRAKIEVVRKNRAACWYLARNMTLWNPELYELVTFNKKLLAKTDRREWWRRFQERRLKLEVGAN